jgi:signal transduction histidine kinase
MDESSSGTWGRPARVTRNDGPDRGAEAVDSGSRMRELIRINHELTSNLDLPNVLHRIVEIGKELLNARYAAIGITGAEQRTAELISTGRDRGVLGSVPDAVLGPADPGEPAAPSTTERPESRSFLSVPIRVHHASYGNLYIADSITGSFTTADEELAEALAATAGIAIQNARLFDASNYRATWSAALADVARRLMENDDEDHVGPIVDEVRRLASAEVAFVALVRPGGHAVVERASGTDSDLLSDLSFPLDHLALSEAIVLGEVLLTDGLAQLVTGHQALPTLPSLRGPTLVVPFRRHDQPLGVLAACRRLGEPGFSTRDAEMAKSFATHISASLERRELVRARRRVAVLEDRGRIARDLHDHVIQRLFATGLNLQGVAAMADGEVAERIAAHVDDIDGAIAQIRQSIFAMRHEGGPDASSLRTRILRIIDRVTGYAPGTTRVVLAGPVDTVVSGSRRDDVAAVVTEALVNVVRHARGTRVDIAVTATTDAVTVEVTDDGVGPGHGRALSGLANLRRRAEALDGTFVVEQAPGGGTHLAWSVPL